MTEWIVAVIEYGQPIAYARCSADRKTIHAFADHVIWSSLSHADHVATRDQDYIPTHITWGGNGDETEMHHWTGWALGGRTVAWTRDSAPATTVGPALRFGSIGGPRWGAPHLVIVRRDDTKRVDVDPWKLAAARTFAQILEAQGIAPSETAA